MPVQYIEQRLNRFYIFPAIGQHILKKSFNTQSGQNVRNALVHGLAQHVIRPAQQHHVQAIAAAGVPLISCLPLNTAALHKLAGPVIG